MVSKVVRLLFAKQRVSRFCKEGTLMKKRKSKAARQRKVNTKKGKRMEITNTDGRAADDADRISELPEHILHQILYLLRSPNDIVRTSILSKKWKVIWESFTSVDVDFDQRRFQNHKVGASNHLQSPPVEEQSASFKQVFKESLTAGYVDLRLLKFILFVENTLATRIEPLPSIQKFRLHVSSFVADLMTPYMNNWISVATDKNVKELDIHVKKADDDYEHIVSQCYALPQVAFVSRTITSLKLHGCGMDVSAVIKLPNLRELSMKAMRINENVIHKIVQGCPLIEDMRLIKCHLLKFLHVSTVPKLKRLEVHEGSNLRSVKLEAPNLETFWFHGKKSSRCKLILAGCGNLKNLMLRHTHMADKSFQERIAEFPLLEKLFLLECHALRRMTILSDKLKKLSVVRCSKLKEANIDAPNLLSFEYTGIELPFSSMNASQLQEVKLHLKSQKQKFHPLEVQKFVQGFEAKGFNLFLASKQDVIIYEEMKGIHFLPSRDFKIELTKSSRVLGNLLNSHLRHFHPKTLILMTSPSSDLLAFKKEIVMNKEKTPSCCKYYSKKCWRHYLEDVRMFEFSPSNINPNTSFELKWRSSPLPLPEDTDITEMDELMVHRDKELTDIDE